MTASLAARFASLSLVLLMLLGSVAPAAANIGMPYARAKNKGVRYTHRPCYKAYRTQKPYGGLFGKKK